MDSIRELAEFYRNDFINTLKGMVKPWKHINFDLKALSVNDFVVDKFKQHYDSEDKSKTFKFSVSDFKNELMITKEYKKFENLYNTKGFPTIVCCIPHNENFWFCFYPTRIIGPTRIVYDYENDKIIEAEWKVIDPSEKIKLTTKEYNEWLDSNGFNKNIFKMIDEMQSLFKMQLGHLVKLDV